MIILAISFIRWRGVEMSPLFPFGEFFETQPTTIDLWSRHTCETQADRDRDCSCSDGCMQYGDCCIDYLWTSAMSPQNLDKYVESFGKSFDEARSGMECEEFKTSLPDGLPGYQYYYMKSTCPEGTVSELERKCTENDGELPVLTSNNTFLYKNMFCAQCNLEFKFEKINYTITCKGNI